MYKEILERLYKGDASCLTSNVIYNINQVVLSLINKEPLTQYEQDIVGDILHISNIIYNNTDKSILVLDDGVYDLLLQKYKRYNPNYQVGAEPIVFTNSNETIYKSNDEVPLFRSANIGKKDMLFLKELSENIKQRKLKSYKEYVF